MKQILLIATGGTIASKYTEHGLAPQISAEEIISYIPTAKEFCQIDTAAPFNLDSTNIDPSHWLLLAELIEKKYEYYDGFVICHNYLRPQVCIPGIHKGNNSGCCVG